MQEDPIKPKKTIICKKPAVVRRTCLNCGKDISHLHKNAKYCSEVCRNMKYLDDPDLSPISKDILAKSCGLL